MNMPGMNTPQPTTKAKPDRTIVVQATDQLRFVPGRLTVRAGETVAFKIVNTGKLPHEFAVGTAAVQQAHEREMARGGPMDMAHDAAFAVDVAPGKTATLVYTFGRPGTLIYGCHTPGHYAAGMKGTITVTSP